MGERLVVTAQLAVVEREQAVCAGLRQWIAETLRGRERGALDGDVGPPIAPAAEEVGAFPGQLPGVGVPASPATWSIIASRTIRSVVNQSSAAAS